MLWIVKEPTPYVLRILNDRHFSSGIDSDLIKWKQEAWWETGFLIIIIVGERCVDNIKETRHRYLNVSLISLS